MLSFTPFHTQITPWPNQNRDIKSSKVRAWHPTRWWKNRPYSALTRCLTSETIRLGTGSRALPPVLLFTQEVLLCTIGPQILKKFYIKSILTGCVTSWYGNCLASDQKVLQRVVCTVQYITGAELPAIQDLYTRRFQSKALKIVKDSSHPNHNCALCYRTASGTDAPSLEPTWPWKSSTPKS